MVICLKFSYCISIKHNRKIEDLAVLLGTDDPKKDEPSENKKEVLPLLRILVHEQPFITKENKRDTSFFDLR